MEHVQVCFTFGDYYKGHQPGRLMVNRYQLEAFVDKVTGKEPAHWISPEDSIAQMRTLDAIYVKSGLGKRPSTASATKSG